MNTVCLLGNMARDPEIRAAGSTTVCSFTVVVNDRYKGKDGTVKERANFIDCKAWGGTGDNIARFFIKGSRVCVRGSLEQETWDDKATGAKRSKIVVRVDDFSFCERAAPQRAGDEKPAPRSAPRPAPDPEVPDDLPF